MGFFRKTSPTNWPHCQICRYCMIGNVSGRCPECGGLFVWALNTEPVRRHGRTAAVVATVVFAIPFLIWITVPKLHSGCCGGHAKSLLAKSAVGRSAPIAKGLGAFRMDMGRFPTTAEALRPLFVWRANTKAGWRGPYMAGVFAELTDPWGKPYSYASPGIHNADGYDLWSSGPDGVDNAGLKTSDDVVNWLR